VNVRHPSGELSGALVQESVVEAVRVARRRCDDVAACAAHVDAVEYSGAGRQPARREPEVPAPGRAHDNARVKGIVGCEGLECEARRWGVQVDDIEATACADADVCTG
jgi:hypothetical protein